jgi:hypothetical protein
MEPRVRNCIAVLHVQVLILRDYQTAWSDHASFERLPTFIEREYFYDGVPGARRQAHNDCFRMHPGSSRPGQPSTPQAAFQASADPATQH